MVNFEIITNRNSLFIILITLSTIMSLIFVRLNLTESSNESTRQFLLVTAKEQSTGSTLDIASKLNAISASPNIRCVEASYNDLVFVKVSKGNCETSFFVEQSNFISSTLKGLVIKISYNLPNYIILSTLLFLMGEFSLFAFLIKLNSEKNRILNLNANIALNISKKVAHDIRSPISVINLLTSSLNELSDDKRNMLKSATMRITNIADDLLNQNKNQIFLTTDVLEKTINDLINEKKMFVKNNNLLVNFQLIFEVAGKFDLTITENDLTRILSNLINNSIEARMGDRECLIKVYVQKTSNFIKIVVEDNGKGIPKNIIGNLGNKGFTYKKNHGNGLGLYFAKSLIEGLSGNINFISNEESNTMVILNLPINFN